MFKKILRGITALGLGLSVNHTHAIVDIRQGMQENLGPFEKMANWLTFYANFMQGPFAMALILGSLILAVCIWVLAPKEGALGFVARAITAGFVVLNAGAWMSSFVN